MSTPDFRIIADSTDITAAIKRGLLSLRVTDEAGVGSDKVEIKLDDRDGKIALPRTGAELDIALGYQETGLVRMGLYIVDEVSIASPPQSMTIRAHAADMRQVLKAPRTKTWGEVTLVDVVNEIAAAHGLEPKISGDMASIQLPYLTQTEESDLHLLTRLARNHGAITKPVHGKLLFVPKGQAKSVSGTLIEPVFIAGHQLTSWEASFADRDKYGSVQASFHNKQTAEKETIKIGGAEPVYTLRHTYDSADQAKQNASAALERLKRGTGTLNISLSGNTRLMSEGKITLSGIRAGVDGEWIATRVDHVLDNSGYQCRLDAETPSQP